MSKSRLLDRFTNFNDPNVFTMTEEDMSEIDEFQSMTQEQQDQLLERFRIMRQMELESIKIFRTDMKELLGNLQSDSSSLVRPDLAILLHETDTEPIWGHKIILCSRSSFFANILQANDTDKLCLSQLDFAPYLLTRPNIQNIVTYLYSGDLSLTTGNVFEIFELCSKMELHHAEELCSLFIKISTDASSVCSLLLSAIKKQDERFIHICYRAVLANSKAVLEDSVFLQLPLDMLDRLVQDEQITCTEMELFLGIMAWCKANQVSQTVVEHLLEHVRFPLMDTDELQQVEKYENIPTDLLMEAYRFLACGDASSFDDDSITVGARIMLQSDRVKPRRLISGVDSSNFILDTHHKGTNIQLKGNYTACKVNLTSYETIIANKGFSNGLHVWEVVLDVLPNSNNLMIGVAHQNVSTTQWLGQNAQGYSWFGQSCYRYHGGSSSSFGGSFRWQQGDVIGVRLDLRGNKNKNGTLSFFKNGQFVGEAYQLPRFGGNTTKPIVYYPAVSFYYKDEQVTVKPTGLKFGLKYLHAK